MFFNTTSYYHFLIFTILNVHDVFTHKTFFMLWMFLLQDLNLYLQDKVYLTGNQFTVADIFMYYGIHPLIVSPLFFWLPHLEMSRFHHNVLLKARPELELLHGEKKFGDI